MRKFLVPFAALIVALTVPAAAQDEDCDQYRAGAEAGASDDQLDLAVCLFGSQLANERSEGMDWARKAMAAGEVEAKNAVAVGLINGIGGETDEAEGQRLMEEAAAEGSYGAQLSLAEHYLNEGGFYEKDDAKGLALLMQAAEGGKVKGPSLGEVEWRIGMMHLDGRGTPKDSEQAFVWVTRGADNGFDSAMISRAVMLATGDGVAEDDAAARDWYSKAIDARGESMFHAMRGLGAMNWFGEGGPVDRAEGCALLNLAYVGGDEYAEEILDSIVDEMTEDEKNACSAETEKRIAALQAES